MCVSRIQWLHMFLMHCIIISTFELSCSGIADGGVEECLARERHGLLLFKQGLIDEYGRLSSWGNEEEKKDCCRWIGVSCSNRTGHVISLDLRASNDYKTPLRGNISSSLLELPHLTYLDLSYNDFGGRQIPDFIGSLHKLRYLNLSSALFGGKVPYQLGNLSSLRSLDLSENLDMYVDKLQWLSPLSELEQLRLNFMSLRDANDWPQVVTQLTSLIELQLPGCQLPASIPPSLSFVNASKSLSVLNLRTNYLPNSLYTWLLNFSSSLTDLDLAFNNLQGPLPDYIFKGMTSLAHLQLYGNKVVGIPNFFRNMCSLKTLELSGNMLSGELHEFVDNLSGCTKRSLEFLGLGANNLSGSLPDITQFSSLRELHLYENSLSGTIAASTGQLPTLVKLLLMNNKIGGSLPDLTAFPSLRYLYISDNRLNGTLTESIGRLSELEVLDASSNYLEGEITETHFSNLSKLTQISLSFNSLSFNFSSYWVPPFKLDVLDLVNCRLGPHFPKWLQGQNSYSVLDISNTGISDIIPPWFWDLSPYLYYLNLSHNNLQGILPDLSLKFDALPGIDLSSNSFEGPIPLFPPNVVSLNLSKNMFSGTLSFLCAIVGQLFSYLDLSENKLSGEIPDCWMRWQRLIILNVGNNNLSGKIPDSVNSTCILQSLHLRGNGFVGEFPPSLKNCKELKIIDAENNRFSGVIPTWIGDSQPSLVVLNLRLNRFYGSIPLQLCRLASLQLLDLSLNNISETIPQCFSNLTAMVQQGSVDAAITHLYPYYYSAKYGGHQARFVESTVLNWKRSYSEYRNTLGLVKSIDLSSNSLRGEIPEEIASLVGLISLNLSRNSLTGSITPKFGQLNLLDSLDLSNNHLHGEIPTSLSQLNFLGVLDLSNNNLSGKIPSGTQLQSFNASAYEGNPELCGPPLPRKCPTEGSSEEPNSPAHEDEDRIITTGFYVSMGLGFIFGFWGVIGTLLMNYRRPYFLSWFRN